MSQAPDQESVVACPGCGLRLASQGLPADPRLMASGECRRVSDQLAYYTLAQTDPKFIHQHLVDAYGAQHVRAGSRSTIGPMFELAGLYLTVECRFTGRKVQLTHIRMARQSNSWPRFEPPVEPGLMTVAEVLATPPGALRDRALLDWCAAVWGAWAAEQPRVRAAVAPFLPPD
ncbi:MAG: DUF5946 family protein [Candidatus Dormibacteria bacterium]